MPDFVLASASPRRVDLLQQVGMRFEQRVADIDESYQSDEPPRDYVFRMARTKARTVWQRLQSESGGRDILAPPVVGADTIVVLANRIITKPQHREDAIDTLLMLSGRCHCVLSAVAVCGSQGEQSLLSETQVTFNHLTAEQCARYWATGEPADKAGAYAIQGRGAVFVKSIQGSYSGVVGLPLAETLELLAKYDISYWQND